MCCEWKIFITVLLQAVEAGCRKLVSSSGGNAGLAAIYSAQELGVPITVVVPETTPSFIVDKMRAEGATVEVLGSVSSCLSACRPLISVLVVVSGIPRLQGLMF